MSNPFLFKHISNLKSIGHFDDVGPCVMMASPGMLVCDLLLTFSNLDYRVSFLSSGPLINVAELLSLDTLSKAH